MKVFLIIITTLLFASNKSVIAQSSDSTELANLSAELDELFANEADSLSLFSLIDSLLAVSSNQNGLSVRLGYSSRVTTAGRDFGVDQQGLSPGISYYHKSGAYGDITGVWNSELDPKYYLTVATIGYLGSFKKNWAYSASYDHSFYHATDTANIFPLTNTLSTSISYDFKHLYSGLNYSYAFGSESAHQLSWNLTGVIRKKAIKPFESISILPSFSIVWGNEIITSQASAAQTPFEQSRNLTEIQIINIIKMRGYNKQQELRFRRKIANSQINTNQEEDSIYPSEFSLLNYYFSLPISFQRKKFNMLISYNYNIPNSISGSLYESESNNSYFGFTLSYNIGL